VFQDYNEVIRAALLRIHCCSLFSLSSGQVSKPPPASTSTNANLAAAVCVIESSRAFYVVQNYAPYTLWDAVVFSPAMMEGSYAKPLFVLYQILRAVKHCHGKGISVGDLRLTDIFIDAKLWVTLCQPSISRLYHTPSAPPEPSEPKPQATEPLYEDLPTLVQKWTYGELSNFDYLMALNRLAGRRMGDPNHHPILPWVVDFTSEDGGYRDLSMSKYRLNKGDAQLELTYDADSPFMAHTDRHGDPLQIPHHVSDMLSDITYFVYRARQVPKAVLCQHVRSKWVPGEYPATMERLQQWTPDECIPEFFTDPQIFSSIHDDLGDLEVPAWCSGPEEFVKKHMAILEGEYVSQRLHHWIDLTFGYKVSSVGGKYP
jgi:WD repeat-containing protein 81